MENDVDRQPTGWRMRRIDDVCRIRSGGTPPKDDLALWAGTFPWASGKDLKRHRLTDTVDHITHEAATSFSEIAPAGSVLALVRGMGLANSFAVSLIERPMAFNQDLKALIPSDEVTGPFLVHALRFAGRRMLQNVTAAAHGTKRLGQDDLRRFELPVPSVQEQTSIAEFLDSLIAAIELEGDALEKTDQLKASAMRTLFTRGQRGDAQKESVVGRVPESWELSDLGSVCSVGNGQIQTGPFGSQLHAHEYETDGVAVVNPTHLAGNRIDHTNVPHVSLETAARLERHVLQRGDILFARRGEIGRLGLVGDRETGWLCGTGCFLVRIDHPKVHNAFLARFFAREEVVAWLSAHAAGAIMPNLNGLVLSRLPLAIPTLSEQHEIVATLDAIDNKLDLHNRKHALLEALFQSLLHKLMTGGIRVSDLDLSTLERATAAQVSA
jgi:type I restriction enzyme, S subunit